MTHVVVLAPGDIVELHWQQLGFQPTVSEVLHEPAAVHRAIVRLSPWTNHLARCARVTDAAACDCGLQAELVKNRGSG